MLNLLGPRTEALLREQLRVQCQAWELLRKAAADHPYQDRVAAAAGNVHPNPTLPQREAANHRMGHVAIHGLEVTIEVAQGQQRRGVGKDGKPWSKEMHCHYGYFKRTESSDGEHVDIYLGPNPESELVFVVDQVKQDGTFDEPKVLLGFVNQEAAKSMYLRHVPGFCLGAITAMTMGDFKEWLQSTQPRRPLALEKAAAGSPPEKKESPPVVAVDVDGTLLEYDGWKGEDHFGAVRAGARDALLAFRAAGAKVAINTCRGDTAKVKAALEKAELPFDYIHENPHAPPGTHASKMSADVYVDDRMVDGRQAWPDIQKEVLARLSREKKVAAVVFFESHLPGR